MDNAILGEDILDGYFLKPSFRNPKEALYEDYLEELDQSIYDIPRTTVKFDTWDSAPFRGHSPHRRPQFKDQDLELLWRWSHGDTIRSLGVHVMKLNRITRKFVKETLERDSHVSQDRESEANYGKTL